VLNTSALLVVVYNILQILNYDPCVPEGRLLCPLASLYGLVRLYGHGFKFRPTRLFISESAFICACNCVYSYGKRND
jgi:hypothetical protein